MKHCYFSPAKLNLFLHITGKRDDGYHNLQSVFCRLDIGDTLTISPSTDNALITLTGADGLTQNPQDNLIIKAAHALHQYSQTHHIGKPAPIAIHLDKKLPIGAGLGGGSSNAATTLLALNDHWQTHLDQATLITLGKRLGADVPFFIFNQTHAIAEGIGDMLTPISLPARRYLLICPPIHHQTAAFFANPTLKKDSAILSHHAINTNRDDFIDKLNSPFFNAFEAIAKQNPAIVHALDYLSNIGTHSQSTPRLTGTGSTVFLPIAPAVAPDTLAQWQKNAPYPAFIATSH